MATDRRAWRALLNVSAHEAAVFDTERRRTASAIADLEPPFADYARVDVARRAGIAAVGNIYTRPEARGRGYGAAVTTAVVSDLCGQGLAEIVPNVAAENRGAARIYVRLGFREHCLELEGYAIPRDPPSDASSRSI